MMSIDERPKETKRDEMMVVACEQRARNLGGSREPPRATSTTTSPSDGQPFTRGHGFDAHEVGALRLARLLAGRPVLTAVGAVSLDGPCRASARTVSAQSSTPVCLVVRSFADELSPAQPGEDPDSAHSPSLAPGLSLSLPSHNLPFSLPSRSALEPVLLRSQLASPPSPLAPPTLSSSKSLSGTDRSPALIAILLGWLV